MLREFWREMSETIHPQDEATLRDNPPRDGFNLDYPPPAFIGEPDAPVVILYANGAYSPERTPLEFASPTRAEELRAALHGRSPPLPDTYGSVVVRRWVAEGLAVRVNAVAYRSPNLSQEPLNRALAERLPSVAVHRKWLREVLLPEARLGRRFVVVHRNGVWNVDPVEVGPNVAFSPHPRFSALANTITCRAGLWLRSVGRDPGRGPWDRVG